MSIMLLPFRNLCAMGRAGPTANTCSPEGKPVSTNSAPWKPISKPDRGHLMRFESAGETKRQTQIRPLNYGKAIEGVKLTALTSFPELPVLTVLQTRASQQGTRALGNPL